MLTATRWTRFGHDRLYVKTTAGETVGWLDLLTGESTVERADLTAQFHEAVRAHQADQGMTTAAPSSAEAVGALTSPQGAVPDSDYAVEVGWTDLALNKPGQGVRAEAESLLAEMKGQSKVGTFLKRAFDVYTDERAFRVGADGEEAVGTRLDRLTKHGARVIHSIPLRPGNHAPDIDHLVIAKGGVYPVNTKRHPGGTVWVGERTILVNGQKTDYLLKSRREAERVRKALLAHLGVEVPVKPVLVFLTGTVIPQVTIKQMPPDVLVLDRMDIPSTFKRAPERMTPEMIERVYEMSRRSSTWWPK
ncbi:MAG: nuclease-related domain-containing protein [Mycobacteriales bacterium]|nr:nuclease-related domain-containing protein [Mycobacteriales bacterium]